MSTKIGGFNYDNTDVHQNGGRKTVRKVAIKNGKGHKSLSHYKKDKKLRGGFLGPVLNEAIVPFGILGMQQNYKKNKSLKGGFLGPVLNEAIVPFGILGMQQTYKKK